MNDKQYGFRWTLSTAHRTSEALSKKYISRTIAFDISKAIDKVWHRWLLHKLSSYGLIGRVFLVIKSFLKGMSMKVFVNGQSSESRAINVSFYQDSPLDSITLYK